LWKYLKKKRKQRKSRNKERISKAGNLIVRGNNLIYTFGVMVFLLGVTLVGLIVLGDKTGISQRELDLQNKIMEEHYETISKGHIGGDVELITEPYENEVSVEEFEGELGKRDKVSVYFYSSYCSYCYKVGDDVIKALSESEQEFIVVNVNREKEFQDKNNAGEVPKVVKYEKGKVLDSLVGEHSLEEYVEFLK